MLSVFRSLRAYGGCRLSTWIYRITRRRIADHLRSPQRRTTPIGLSNEFPLQTGEERRHCDPERQAAGSELRGSIARLHEPPRSIVLAYHLGEMSVREIARELKMPESTVKSHLRRSRVLLRRWMGEQ